MTSVTRLQIDDRASAISAVLDAWVRATRAFATAGVYPVETGIPGVSLDRVTHTMLRELVQRGPQRLGDLALASDLKVSHASRLVEGLVRAGLVERTTPAEDRRVTILDVSPAGRGAIKEIEQQFLGLIGDRLASFDEREAVQFAMRFQGFADQLETWSRTGTDTAEGVGADG